MKFVLFLLAIPAAAAAFSSRPAFVVRNPTSCLNMVKTGPQGKPAKTSEEDLELTRQVIHEFLGDDETPAEEAPKASKAAAESVKEEA
jgi:hypothetical protein